MHHANLFDRVEQSTGIVPFGRLVDRVMTVEPYRSAQTVYWIVDHGSSHAGKASVKRMRDKYPNARLIHLPVHASWINQIEIYFDRATQGADPQRLRDAPRARAAPDGLRPALPHHRQAVPMDMHARKLDRVIEKIANHDPHQLPLAA